MAQVALFTIRAWEENVRRSQTAGVWKCDTLQLEAAIFQSAAVRPTYLVFYSSDDRTTWKRTGLARVSGIAPVAPIQWRTYKFVVDQGTSTFPISWVLLGSTRVPGTPQNGERWNPQGARRQLEQLMGVAPASPARAQLSQDLGVVPLLQTTLQFTHD